MIEKQIIEALAEVEARSKTYTDAIMHKHVHRAVLTSLGFIVVVVVLTYVCIKLWGNVL